MSPADPADHPAMPQAPGVDGLGVHMGIRYVRGIEEADGHMVAEVEITDAIRQPFGIVHGGAYAAMAESTCSIGTQVVVGADGMVAMGQSNLASFLRPAGEGTITLDARARHRGRTTWLWDCEFTDAEERLLAVVRMTIAVRPRPG